MNNTLKLNELDHESASNVEKLEVAKNPGLGIRKLHEQGIDGRGVNVAILDQKLLRNHVEYQDAIIGYEELGDEIRRLPAEMHGSAVMSILAGKECGVAPGVKVVYEATVSNLEIRAQALERIVNEAKERNVRVVSCSRGFSNSNPEPGIDNWKEALAHAEKEGLIVVHSSMKVLDFSGGGMPYDKENIDKFVEASWLRREGVQRPSAIHVPSDFRTVASETGGYRYDEEGGLSWAVPYLAGVIALILQVNSGLSQEQVCSIIEKTAKTNAQGLRILDPVGAVTLARHG